MEIISSQKINKEIKTTLARYGVEESEYKYVDFIIERFFHYMIPVLLHGISCSIPKMFKFSLVYLYYQFIPKSYRKNMFFSSKAFGYSFFISAESKNMSNYNYIYKTNRSLLKRIAEHNEGDIIYKLLKK